MRVPAFLAGLAVLAPVTGTTANAQVYCTRPGVLVGCVAPGAGVGVNDNDPNRGGPVNRPGRR